MAAAPAVGREARAVVPEEALAAAREAREADTEEVREHLRHPAEAGAGADICAEAAAAARFAAL